MAPLQGSITEEDRSFIETWESVSEQQNYIVRLDRRGDDAPELIQGPRQFRISTYERILTQDKIRDVKLDPFKNGCFRPLVVPPDVTVDSNPNAISDADIVRLFSASDVAWNEWMLVIDSPATLRRMLDQAEVSTVSLKRYREIEAREVELNPVRRITQKDQDQYEKLGGNPAAGGAEVVGRARRQGGTSVTPR